MLRKLIFVFLAVSSAVADTAMTRKRSERELQGGKVEAYYNIDSILTSDCRFPPVITYIVTCSGDGTAVALDDDENLGQAKCKSINSKTLECADDSLNALGGNPATMKCVGNSERDVQVTATLVEGTLECPAFSTLAVYSRWLSVTRVCIEFPELPNFFKFIVPGSRNCVNSFVDDLFAQYCQSQLTCGLFGSPPCTSLLPLPAITYEILDTMVPPECLFSDGLVPPGFSRPDLSGAPGNTAEYEVAFFTSTSQSSACSVLFPATLTLSCGEAGAIDLLPEFQWTLDGGVCRRQGTSTITCDIDVSVAESTFRDGDIGGSLLASCTGASVEALAMSVVFLPGKMICSTGDIYVLSYSTSLLQRCTGVKRTPFGDYAGLLDQQCSPVTASAYISHDTDNDGENDVVTESCVKVHNNCLPEAFCEADGSQELGEVGTRIHPHLVDVDCLVQGGPIVIDPTCVDDTKKKNLFFGIRINGKERSCDWLSKSSNKVKKWYCKNEKEARQRCAACGRVTADEEDPTRMIDAYKVQKRDCAWLRGRNDAAAMCEMSRDARKFCKKTCNRCG